MFRKLYSTALLSACLLLSSCTNSQSKGKTKAGTSPATAGSASASEVKAAVKQASIAFLKWVDYKWEGEKVKITPVDCKYIDQIIVYRKGTVINNQCPCKINWTAMDKLDAWMKANAPIISNKYMADFRQEIKKLEPYLNKTHDDFEAEPPYNAFHFSVGNGGLPELDKTDIYKNTSVWKIDLTTDTTASVNITFRMPKEWGGEVNAYQFKMVREVNSWKAAANIDEGIISPLYK